MQYAGVHLHTPLLIVLGHEGCGAVDAAIAERFHGVKHRSRIEILLREIVPTLDTIDPTLPPAELLEAAVEANVRGTLARILGSPEWRANAAPQGMRAVGAVYELTTGLVQFLE